MENYIIETRRLILREFTIEDLDCWYKILSDNKTMQYYLEAFDLEKVRSWIEWNMDNYHTYGFGLWAVILKDTNQFIGDCGITMQDIHGDGVLFPEIGYHIDKNHWCNGYATESAKACLKYAFETHKFDEVFSYQKWTNTPSRKVAEKIGMLLREEFEDQKNTKTSVYSITRKEYENGY